MILKQMLKTMNVEFIEVDAVKHAIHLSNQGFRTAPVIEIDGELYQTTDITRLKEILRETHVLEE